MNTMMERKARMKTGNSYILRAVMVAALGGLLFGYDTSVVSGAIGYLRTRFALDAAQMGWAAASALAGCVIGCLFAGMLSDRYGRKKILIFAAILYLVSAVGSALAVDLNTFVILRIIGGIGVGFASLVSPLYIAEISPADIRGRMVSYNQFAIVSGILLVYFVNYFIAAQGTETWNVNLGWRWMFGSESLPALLFLACLFFVPESPRWLIKQGQTDQATNILERISDHASVREQVNDIRETILHENSNFSQILKPGLRTALIIGIVLAVLQQVSGINVFLYYGPEIFKNLGAGANAALLQTIIVGAFNMGFTIVAIRTVDKLGRRALMMLGAAGMSFCLFAMGLAAWLQQSPIWQLVFILGFISCFSLSVGPVTWVILSEIYPTRIRGRAISVATVFLWAANWLVSQTFPILDENAALVRLFNHGFTFWVYGVMCLILFFFVRNIVPETKGRSLEEIEGMWLGSKV